MASPELVADLAKKSGLVWLVHDGSTHPLWHAWVGDAVCVVTGGAEQPLPELTDGTLVRLLLRSKTTRALVADVAAVVEHVAPDSEHWESVTTTLKAGRLNLPDADADGAVDRWARESRVVRLVPTDDLRTPGAIATDLPATSPRLVRRS